MDHKPFLFVIVLAQILLAACTGVMPPTATPAPARFRSDDFHLDVTLPPGWEAVEGPEYLASPYTGLVAFNSWAQPGFWVPEVTTGESAYYSKGDILQQIPDTGAYIVLVHQSGGPAPESAEVYGPEYDRPDLTGLWESHDCRQRVTWAGFFKWGRSLRLEVYCGRRASDDTVAAVNALLASWRFDSVAVGDFGWASVTAREWLPPAVQPARFPVLGAGSSQSSAQEGDLVRVTQAQAQGDTVVVTFMYRWDEPESGSYGDDCPAERCHWWRFEARPDGKVVLHEEGGPDLPDL